MYIRNDKFLIDVTKIYGFERDIEIIKFIYPNIDLYLDYKKIISENSEQLHMRLHYNFLGFKTIEIKLSYTESINLCNMFKYIDVGRYLISEFCKISENFDKMLLEDKLNRDLINNKIERKSKI